MSNLFLNFNQFNSIILQNNMLEVILKLFVAAICGGAIGYEREDKNQNVGTRTYMTVCLSTAVIMIIARFAFYETNSGDITRMAAAAIQGISFLGAGLIIHKGDHLEGITTAAILWGTAVIGLAIGFGLYFVGIFATIFLLIIGNLLIKVFSPINDKRASKIKRFKERIKARREK